MPVSRAGFDFANALSSVSSSANLRLGHYVRDFSIEVSCFLWTSGKTSTDYTDYAERKTRTQESGKHAQMSPSSMPSLCVIRVICGQSADHWRRGFFLGGKLRQGFENFQRILHVSERRGNLHALDLIADFQKRLTGDLQSFVAAGFFADGRRSAHAFHD